VININCIPTYLVESCVNIYAGAAVPAVNYQSKGEICLKVLLSYAAVIIKVIPFALDLVPFYVMTLEEW